jgi:transposase-like protein
MESQVSSPKTLTEAIRHYSDAQTCINAVALMRWQDGSPVCPHCNAAQGPRNHYWLKTQRRWKCYSCRKQFSVKVGTIFEDSPLSLDVWMIALWMLCNSGLQNVENRLGAVEEKLDKTRSDIAALNTTIETALKTIKPLIVWVCRALLAFLAFGLTVLGMWLKNHYGWK